MFPSRSRTDSAAAASALRIRLAADQIQEQRPDLLEIIVGHISPRVDDAAAKASLLPLRG
jgi:hypothetical protein